MINVTAMKVEKSNFLDLFASFVFISMFSAVHYALLAASLCFHPKTPYSAQLSTTLSAGMLY